jgi:hypothetical protein
MRQSFHFTDDDRPAPRRPLGLLLAVLPLLAACTSGPAPQKPDRDVPRADAWQSYDVYQPAIEHAVVVNAAEQSLRYNHDSSVAWFGDRWFCLWNAHTIPEEGAPGQLNYVSTSRDGLTWSPPRAVFSDPALSVAPIPCPRGTQWQPNLLVVGDRLWCLWCQHSNDAYDGCYFSVLDAPDGRWTHRRLTWEGRASPVIDGKPFQLFPTQNPIRLSTGRVLAPVTLIGPRSAHAAAIKNEWCAGEKRNSVLYTDDGATWHVSPGTGLPGLDWRQWEPTVCEQPDGSVLMFARNNLIPAFEHGTLPPSQALTWAVSRDGGATWSPEAFVPLETVVSRMHVLRQPASDRYLLLHNDWPAGRFCADRNNLALFVNRGGGIDFTAGIGLTGREPEVAYPQMALYDNALLFSYSQGPCGLRNIRVVRVSPLPDPARRYLYPRDNLPPAPRYALTNGMLVVSGGTGLVCRVAPVISTDRVHVEAEINPDNAGVLFDNRSARGGFVWGFSGTAFVHVGDPAKNLRSALPIPSGRWSRVGVTIDYPKGVLEFTVNGQFERVFFRPGHRSLSGASATLFAPHLASSALTPFAGAVRSLTLDGTNRLFDASGPSARATQVFWPRIAPADTASVRVLVGEDGRRCLRFRGEASAGVELDAHERAAGDGVEFAFDFSRDGRGNCVLCTVGDANQPARVVCRDDRIFLCAGTQTNLCGTLRPGAWQHLELASSGDRTRVAINRQPPAEIRHTPQATWLYLGQGYRPETPSPSSFDVDVATVRSRITRSNACNVFNETGGALPRRHVDKKHE